MRHTLPHYLRINDAIILDNEFQNLEINVLFYSIPNPNGDKKQDLSGQRALFEHNTALHINRWVKNMLARFN